MMWRGPPTPAECSGRAAPRRRSRLERGFVRRKLQFPSAPFLVPPSRKNRKPSDRLRVCTKLIFSLAGLLFAMSCSPRDFLTRRLASDLISASADFRSSQRFIVQTGVVSGRDYPSPEYLVLQNHGWISATSAPCPREVAPPPCWDVLLTPSGVDAVHTALPAEQAAGSLLAVPVAKRVLLDVTGISKQGASADV